jgi:hypothetical protein
MTFPFLAKVLCLASGRAVCGRVVAGIAGSNAAEGVDARLLCLFCR